MHAWQSAYINRIHYIPKSHSVRHNHLMTLSHLNTRVPIISIEHTEAISFPTRNSLWRHEQLAEILNRSEVLNRCNLSREILASWGARRHLKRREWLLHSAVALQSRRNRNCACRRQVRMRTLGLPF